MESKVGVAIERIRDHVNRPRLRERNSAIPDRWDQICSAMDFLGDIALALSSYLEPETKTTDGERYLRAYGALQALEVQQDAVSHLREALGALKPPPNTELLEIRDLRHRSIGHPTKTRPTSSRPKLFNFIVRMSLRQRGFELRSSSGTGTELVIGVNIPALISRQDSILGDQLAAVEAHLMEDERRHRAEFAGQKLQAAFRGTLGYAFEKIGQGLRDERFRTLAQWGVDHIKQDLNSFRMALENRGLSVDTYQGVAYAFAEIEYPLRQLEDYVHGRPSDIGNRDAGRVFLSFLRDQVSGLENMAADLDREYESPVDQPEERNEGSVDS
jgi:hypothetical protein